MGRRNYCKTTKMAKGGLVPEVDDEDREYGYKKLATRMSTNEQSRRRLWAGDEQETDMNSARRSQDRARGWRGVID